MGRKHATRHVSFEPAYFDTNSSQGPCEEFAFLMMPKHLFCAFLMIALPPSARPIAIGTAREHLVFVRFCAGPPPSLRSTCSPCMLSVSFRRISFHFKIRGWSQKNFEPALCHELFART